MESRPSNPFLLNVEDLDFSVLEDCFVPYIAKNSFKKRKKYSSTKIPSDCGHNSALFSSALLYPPTSTKLFAAYLEVSATPDAVEKVPFAQTLETPEPSSTNTVIAQTLHTPEPALSQVPADSTLKTPEPAFSQVYPADPTRLISQTPASPRFQKVSSDEIRVKAPAAQTLQAPQPPLLSQTRTFGKDAPTPAHQKQTPASRPHEILEKASPPKPAQTLKAPLISQTCRKKPPPQTLETPLMSQTFRKNPPARAFRGPEPPTHPKRPLSQTPASCSSRSEKASSEGLSKKAPPRKGPAQTREKPSLISQTQTPPAHPTPASQKASTDGLLKKAPPRKSPLSNFKIPKRQSDLQEVNASILNTLYPPVTLVKSTQSTFLDRRGRRFDKPADDSVPANIQSSFSRKKADSQPSPKLTRETYVTRTASQRGPASHGAPKKSSFVWVKTNVTRTAPQLPKAHISKSLEKRSTSVYRKDNRDFSPSETLTAETKNTRMASQPSLSKSQQKTDVARTAPPPSPPKAQPSKLPKKTSAIRSPSKVPKKSNPRTPTKQQSPRKAQEKKSSPVKLGDVLELTLNDNESDIDD